MYYIVFLYLVILYILSDEIPKRLRWFCGAIPFVLIVFLRYGVGADYFSYMYIYEKMNINDISKSLALFPNTEITYKWLNLIAKSIGINYYWFMTIGSLFIFTVIYYVIQKKSEIPELSLLLYYSMFFLVWNLSAFRQGIALAIFTFFILFKDELSIFMKIFLMIIAAIFHLSVLVPAVVYLISKLNWNWKRLICLLILSIFVSIIPLKYILSQFEDIALINRVLVYVTTDSSLISFPVIIRIAISTILIFMYEKLIQESPKDTIIYNFIIINLLMYIFLFFSPITAGRLSIYGYFLIILVAPNVINQIPLTKSLKVLLVVVGSFIYFNKEFNTTKNQSSYAGSNYELNRVNIFNPEIKSFGSSYAFNMDVILNTLPDTELWRNISKGSYATTEYNSNDIYISVYFPVANRYGTINLDGEVLGEPKSEYRYKIYGDIKEVIYNTDGFKTIKYTSLETDETIHYNIRIDDFLTFYIQELDYQDRWNEKQEVSINDLNIGYLKEFNLTSFETAVLYNSDFNDDLHYLHIKDFLGSKFLILKDDKPLIEKWYDRIDTYNTSGVIKGFYGDYVDYINDRGKVIWIERINEIEN